MPDQDSSPILQLSEKDIQRFWAKVDRRGPDECWIWQGTKLPEPNAYGIIKIGKQQYVAHRISWVLYFGAIPDLFSGKTARVCHDCRPAKDNRLCVNPGHLWLGSDEDNMRDAARKGAFINCLPILLKAQKTAALKLKSKTACKRGHLFTPENTYRTKRGRMCRECRRMHDRKRRPGIPAVIRHLIIRKRGSSCKKGHAYTLNNTYIYRGKRRCRECAKLTARRLRAKRVGSK